MEFHENVPYKFRDMLKMGKVRVPVFILAPTRENFNNKGAGQPSHPQRLISVFVIRFLVRITSKLATSELICLRKIKSIQSQVVFSIEFFDEHIWYIVHTQNWNLSCTSK